MNMAEDHPCEQLIDHSHIPDFEVRLVVKISLTIIYGIILLAGIVGNSVTIQTTKVLRDKGYLQKGVTDHMISLACSDLLLILLGMPVELYSVIWFPLSSTYGNITCKVYCFLFEACSYATIFHVATLSFERYMAICHPFSFKAVSGTRVVKLMIGFAWLTSVCVALPLIFAMGAEYPLSPMSGRRSQCNTSTSYHMNGNFTLCTNLHSKWTAFQASIFSAFVVYIVVLASVAFMCRKMMVILMVTKKGTITVKGQPGTSVTNEMTKSNSSEARSARKQTIVFLDPNFLSGTHSLQPGDWVVTKIHNRSSLEPRYSQPVEVQLVTATSVKLQGRANWIHASHCKKVISPDDVASNDDVALGRVGVDVAPRGDDDSSSQGGSGQ